MIEKTQLIVRFREGDESSRSSIQFFKKVRVKPPDIVKNARYNNKLGEKDEVKETEEFEVAFNPSYKNQQNLALFEKHLSEFVKESFCKHQDPLVPQTTSTPSLECSLTFSHHLLSPKAFTWKNPSQKNVYLPAKSRHQSDDDALYNGGWIAGNELLTSFVDAEIQQFLWFIPTLDIALPGILTLIILIKYAYDLYKSYLKDNEGLPLTHSQKMAIQDKIIRMAIANIIDMGVWVGVDLTDEILLPLFLTLLKSSPTTLNPLAGLGFQALLSIGVGIIIGLFSLLISIIFVYKEKRWNKNENISFKQEMYDSLKFALVAGLVSALWFFISGVPVGDFLQPLIPNKIASTLISTFLKAGSYYGIAKCIGFDLPKKLGVQHEEDYDPAKGQKYMLSSLTSPFFCVKPKPIESKENRDHQPAESKIPNIELSATNNSYEFKLCGA